MSDSYVYAGYFNVKPGTGTVGGQDLAYVRTAIAPRRHLSF